MKLIPLYKAILTAGSLVADDDGLISGKIDTTTHPFHVKGKRLVLPTQEHLSNPDPENKVMFHPLSENILRGESDVISKFRSAINVRINYVLGCLFEELMVIGTSVKMHAQLNPEQAELLSVLKDADEKTLSVLQSLLEVISTAEAKDKGFVYIFLKRGGNVNGKNYGRAAIINFPFYEELIKDDKDNKKVFGVNVRTKDKLMLIALFEFIFTKVKEPGAYNYGSDSSIAPFLDSLMNGVIQLAGCVNAIVDRYSDFLSDADKYRYSDEWVEVFDNLAQLLPEIRNIPMQAGNEGSTGREVTQTTVSAPAQLQTPSHVVQNVSQPVPVQFQQPIQQQSTLVTTENGLDIAATLRASGMNTGFQTFGMPAQQQMNTPVGFGGFNNGWQQPQFQQQGFYNPVI